jgi:hypothetical protein
MNELISQRAYARHRECRVSAVQRAIAEGRLVDCLKKNARGHWQITSLAAADKEWAKNTRPSPVKRAENKEAQRGLDDADVDYSEAKRRREIESLKVAKIQAEHQRLDLAERSGDLLSATQARADMVEVFTHVRTKLLGIPTRCKQRIQGLTNKDVKVIDSLVREALEALAEGN